MNIKRLFIVSSRLPVHITENEKGITINPSSGGLVSAMNSYLQHQPVDRDEIYWAGIPGCTISAWQKSEAQLSSSAYHYIPLPITRKQYEDYYNGFSNSVLWPLFHYFPSYAEYNPEYYQQYKLVNEQFCATLLKHLRPNDVVWIHDYHLLLLPALLRKHFPELKIGFFLHIPFPSHELFRLMPRNWQEELLKGLLGADLIGFHTIDYTIYFLQTLQMVLGLDHERHVLKFDDRLIKADVFPIGIDYYRFYNSFHLKEVKTIRDELTEKHKGKQIIFSVDRLDYTKGLLNRLKAYEHFLLYNPDYHEKVVFILIIVPSRDTISRYAERKKVIDETISGINSSVGNFRWQPIIYQYNPVQFEELIGLYTSADVALITPLRDGMNLVAKEFVASRQDQKGVLILSEMTGASRELTNALNINPNDTHETACKIKQGLEMSILEQQNRLSAMQHRIKNYSVQTWAEDFLIQLEKIKHKQQEFQVKFIDDITRIEIITAYQKSKKRLLLLDYDGTLVPFASFPEIATPDKTLIELLKCLSSMEENEIYIISGRKKDWLEKWFGGLQLNLIAEHGATYKLKNSEWASEISIRNEWKKEAEKIMKNYERRCVSSFVEVKDFSIVWHYRNSIAEQGKIRAQELVAELNAMAHNQDLQVLTGNKIVELRTTGIDKGLFTQNLLNKNDYDFILSIGDDRTDEDMFRILANIPNTFSIKVGPEASFAHYNLLTPGAVLSFLQLLQRAQNKLIPL